MYRLAQFAYILRNIHFAATYCSGWFRRGSDDGSENLLSFRGSEATTLVSDANPAKRIASEKEEQGSERSFRRKAEAEPSGLCDDAIPPLVPPGKRHRTVLPLRMGFHGLRPLNDGDIESLRPRYHRTRAPRVIFPINSFLLPLPKRWNSGIIIRIEVDYAFLRWW